MKMVSKTELENKIRELTQLEDDLNKQILNLGSDLRQQATKIRLELLKNRNELIKLQKTEKDSKNQYLDALFTFKNGLTYDTRNDHNVTGLIKAILANGMPVDIELRYVSKNKVILW